MINSYFEKKSITTRTPMRITLGGGGTDVLWYSQKKGGAWISAAINQYVYVKLKKSHKMAVRIISKDHSFEINDNNNPIILECFKLANIKKNLNISIFSDASPKSGLGGSGAFEVGLLHALFKHKKTPITQVDLAKKASDIEIIYLKKPVGPQDQYITALGGIKYFEIDRNGDVYFEPLYLSSSTLEKLRNNLLFFKTGIQRDASSVLNDEKKATKQGLSASSKLIQALDQIKALGKEVKKYLLKGKVDDFGESLHQHWLIKKSLSNKVSCSKIDLWYNEGIRSGALGGKIIGAGGGGWLVFYVNKNKTRFREKMSKKGLMECHVNFDWHGTVAF